MLHAEGFGAAGAFVPLYTAPGFASCTANCRLAAKPQRATAKTPSQLDEMLTRHQSEAVVTRLVPRARVESMVFVRIPVRD